MGKSKFQNVYSSKRWQRLRLEVLKRDGYLCQWPECSKFGGEVDHIIPMPTGATWDTSNLQVLCSEHHRIKTRAERGIGVSIPGHYDWKEYVNLLQLG